MIPPTSQESGRPILIRFLQNRWLKNPRPELLEIVGTSVARNYTYPMNRYLLHELGLSRSYCLLSRDGLNKSYVVMYRLNSQFKI